jgi:hypothetical protein
VQDFRTRLVCPECGESEKSELAWHAPFDPTAIVSHSLVRRCLDCEHIWWVDWALRPTAGVR